jgi:choline-phosphate cytidylyltransferase
MVKVITYGTYDLLHFGHIRLLQRAKALGDYLIVGVTADGFDKARGKINVQQSLMERIEAVKATGLADEIIVEEYEGQKIDDILRFKVDIFAIGSDWIGKFDYLKEYCQVVYLERTQGVSSSELRSQRNSLKLALVGDELWFLTKFERESHFVNGIEITGIYSSKDNFSEALKHADAVFLNSKPQDHYWQIKAALEQGKHVLCDTLITTKVVEWEELTSLANQKGCILMDALRTAYSTAYYRLLLLVKSGVLGDVVSVDASCTSLRDKDLKKEEYKNVWNSICAWGPTAMLPIFQILGTNYVSKQITSRIVDDESMYDSFTKVTFVYPKAVASIKVGKGVKTEGELVISGTEGYIYVPAPWWKTEYFEVRREDSSQNKRYFYQLDGEGIRYELISFLNAIEDNKENIYIKQEVSRSIVQLIEDYYDNKIIKL